MGKKVILSMSHPDAVPGRYQRSDQVGALRDRMALCVPMQHNNDDNTAANVEICGKLLCPLSMLQTEYSL